MHAVKPLDASATTDDLQTTDIEYQSEIIHPPQDELESGFVMRDLCQQNTDFDMINRRWHTARACLSL